VNNYFGSGFPGDFGCPVYAAIVNNDDVVSIESGKEDYASDRNFFIICWKYDGYILWGCTPFCKDVLLFYLCSGRFFPLAIRYSFLITPFELYPELNMIIFIFYGEKHCQ